MNNYNELRKQVRDAFVDDEKSGMFPTVDWVMNYLIAQGRIVPDGFVAVPLEPKYKRVDLDALCKNTCNCEGDGGPCMQCAHDFGWNEALEYIKSKYGDIYVMEGK